MPQKWEYKIFASHLDPAELVVIFDGYGREGWELVTTAAVADSLPVEVVQQAGAVDPDAIDADEEVVHLEAFRYIFKRPLP